MIDQILSPGAHDQAVHVPDLDLPVLAHGRIETNKLAVLIHPGSRAPIGVIQGHEKLFISREE